MKTEFNEEDLIEIIDSTKTKKTKSKKNKMSKTKKWTIILSILAIVLIAAELALVFTFDWTPTFKYTNSKSIPPVKPQVKIVDLNSNSRPIAVMVNNHEQARKNHAGLQDAYLAYEIIVEGGLTRYMAVFKDKDTNRIGSVRSSRHYFLDYALENDVVYTHFGWSTQAQSDMRKLGINNINGLYDNAFWRDNTLNVAYEHTAFTSMEKIKDIAQKYGYSLTSDKKTLLNYSVIKIKMEELIGAIPANNISIDYSYHMNTSYEYDSENRVYKRIVNNEAHTDAVTKAQYTAQNIITYKVNNYTMDNVGHQELENIGSGEGYYISGGYAVPITWEKTSRSSQTIYKYMDGQELRINDGNTWIQIQPDDQSLEIS